ncbi:MAG: insulinase family protein [Enterobacteriaceae bacterium]|jgi:predicted Zn-dependent peptidase|nr:insulinase family protein [Enterobacteriaceae bacterium]
MQNKYWFSALSGLLLICTGMSVQAELLIADPSWQEGKLENGLKWQILTTPHRPSDQIEVRLEINAGSLQESISQVGFSYLLPRLAIEKSDNLSAEETQSLLSQITSESEPKSLVEVSYDYTRYNLSLPTNKPDLLKSAFVWLSGAVSAPTVSNDVMQSLSQQPASPLITLPDGINDAWWRYRIQHSPLVGHEPGQATSNEATPEQLAEFYQKWYTPDAMTLYIVGNVDRRSIVEQINKSFGGLTGNRIAPATIAALSPLPATPVDFMSQGIEKDRLRLVWDDPWHPVISTSFLERYWLNIIANDLIKNRLSHKLSYSSMKSSSVDLNCLAQYQRYQCDLTLDAPLSAVKSGLKFIATELAKLDKDGVTEAELNTLLVEQKEPLIQMITTYAKTDTNKIMAQYLLVQKSGSIAISPEAYQQLRQRFLDKIDLIAVNTRIHQLLTIKPTIVLTQPAGEAEENVKVLSDLFDSIMTPKEAEPEQPEVINR